MFHHHSVIISTHM